MTKSKHTTGSPGRVAPARPRGVPTAVTVLHVDDDPNDTELLRAAARKAEVEFILHNAEDADQALAYLSGKGIYADREKYEVPALVLLDLKMPRATGFEVLKWIRQRPALAHLPVVILSGSELHDDMEQAYAAGANSYFVKPLGFDALVQLVSSINSAWIAALPKPGQAQQVEISTGI